MDLEELPQRDQLDKRRTNICSIHGFDSMTRRVALGLLFVARALNAIGIPSKESCVFHHFKDLHSQDCDKSILVIYSFANPDYMRYTGVNRIVTMPHMT